MGTSTVTVLWILLATRQLFIQFKWTRQKMSHNNTGNFALKIIKRSRDFSWCSPSIKVVFELQDFSSSFSRVNTPYNTTYTKHWVGDTSWEPLLRFDAIACHTAYCEVVNQCVIPSVHTLLWSSAKAGNLSLDSINLDKSLWAFLILTLCDWHTSLTHPEVIGLSQLCRN